VTNPLVLSLNGELLNRIKVSYARDPRVEVMPIVWSVVSSYGAKTVRRIPDLAPVFVKETRKPLRTSRSVDNHGRRRRQPDRRGNRSLAFGGGGF